MDLSKKLVVIALLAAVVVATPYLLVYAFPKDNVDIDGYFMDWINAQMYRDTPDSENPDIALRAYAMKYDARGTFFYIATDGTMLQGRDGGADGFYIFIDRDNNPASGYSVRGLGADAMVSVMGWNSSVANALTYIFDGGASRLDFNGFRYVSPAYAAAVGGELEVGSVLSVDGNSRIAICSRHTDSPGDWSEVNFRARGTSVLIHQYFAMPSVLATGSDAHALTLDISAKGPGAVLDSISFDLLGNVTPSSISASENGVVLGYSTGSSVAFNSPIEIDSHLHRIVVSAELPTVLGGSFGLQLNETSLAGSDRNATWVVESVQTGSRVAYLGYAPSRIAIDGAFADWSSRAPIRDRLDDAYSSETADNTSGDVDISTVKLASTASVASFYMAVNGTMLGGSSTPIGLIRVVAPEPAANITNITERLYGADFAFVFIDADHNMSTGFEVGGAEVALAVVGKGNSILTSKYLLLERGAWVETGDAEAAVDSYQLEVSASYSSLGLTPGETYTVTMLAQDWSGRMDDIALPLPARFGSGARAYPGVIINEIYSRAPPGGGNDWIELFNTGATAVTIGGWQVWLDGLLVYTYPTVTLQPGQLYVTSRLSFGKSVNYLLTDSSGNIIDQVTTPDWQGRSYGRIGYPPYSSWALMTPTPGSMNVGQYIPEFSPVLIAAAIVPIVLIAIRRARARAPRKPADERGGES